MAEEMMIDGAHYVPAAGVAVLTAEQLHPHFHTLPR